MPSALGLSIHFLDPVFHGRRDGGEPEWPPSPLRVLQSLIAAAARRGDGRLPKGSELALLWMERQRAPTLIAPAAMTGSGYRLSVPNNAMDIVAGAWSRGNTSNAGDANPATHRTMKTVIPTWMVDGDTIRYLWALPEPVTDEVRGHLETLCATARSVVALGWGIDMVVAHGAVISDEEVGGFPGERWLPVEEATGNRLRVPKEGTLRDLVRRHERFLSRLHNDDRGRTTFDAPPPLTVFDVVGYRRATDSQPRAAATFALLRLDGTRFRPFDPARRGLSVAGMVRHATRMAAESTGKPKSWIDTFVLGHGEMVGATEHKAVGADRFAYLPLPSIERRGDGHACHVGSVRRVMLTCMKPGHQDEIAWARRSLSGQDLVDERKDEPAALLRLLPNTDGVLQHYVHPASTWATVTPVVLPGFDDPEHYRRRLQRGTTAEQQKRLLARLTDRIDGLLRKAIVQAGLPSALAAHATLEWRQTGFWPGTERADAYGVPDHLKRFPRLHVKVTWRDAAGGLVALPGPLCIGGGRFYGLGLLVGLPASQ